MTTEGAGATPIPPCRKLGSVPALDGLRGLAITLVLLSHLALLDPFGVTGIARVDDFLRGGWLGVDLFFVLSGFLITALLLGEQGTHGSVRFGSFYGRRALRLLPALYALFVIHAIYTLVTDLPWREEWLSIRDALVYATNWQLVGDPASVVPGFVHLWSLAVEEQFYILWPALLLGFLSLRRSGRTVTIVLVAAIALIALHRARLFDNGVPIGHLFVRTDTRADSLLIGALLASMWVRGLTPRRGINGAAWIGGATLVVLVSQLSTSDSFNYQGGFTLIALCGAALVLAAVDGTWAMNRVLVWGPLRLLGRVSYGLYLWHVVIFVAVQRSWSSGPTAVKIPVALALTAAFTAGSWLVIERPALRLKRRFERPSTPAAV